MEPLFSAEASAVILDEAVGVPEEADGMRGATSARLRATRRLASRLKSLRRRDALIFAAALIPLALIVLPLLWLVFHVYFDRSDVPNLDAFIRFELPRTGVVHDEKGSVLIEVAHEYRQVVPYDEIPPIVRQAILSAEDKSFFEHSGVDYDSIPRVVRKMAARSYSEWRKDGTEFRLLLPQGGSTLTQQLVRGYFLQPLMVRSDADPIFHEGFAAPRFVASLIGASATNKLSRKMEEVRLSLWLEREMRRRHGTQERAKREIFARYANFIYLGHGRYGYAAASSYYFGKPLKDYTQVDAGNAALLASISKSPNEYSPAPGNEPLIRRRNLILSLMARNGYIPAKLAASCQTEPILVAARNPIKTTAPAVIEHIFDELNARGGSLYGVDDLFQGKISVETTVDVRVQAIVNDALEQGLARYEERHPKATGVIQGSIVVLRNGDAAILAEAGGRQTYAGRSTRYSDLNRATRTLRQPGSAMKPLVYLAAFEQGITLDTEVADSPISVPLGSDGGTKWIANYDNKFKGPISIRQALAESRNSVAIRLTQEIGISSVIRSASNMGIRTPLHPYASTALGASEVQLIELANAYRAIASGVAAETHAIQSVTSVSGETLYAARRHSEPIRSASLSAIQEGLRGVVRLPSGTAHSLNSRDFPIAVMGKTGTTSEFRDALFVGSTYGVNGITVAVWIGFDDGSSLGKKETGGKNALPIFREIMLRVYDEKLVGEAPKFPHAIESGIDAYLVAQAELRANQAEMLALEETRSGIFLTEAAARSLRGGPDAPTTDPAAPFLRGGQRAPATLVSDEQDLWAPRER